MTEITRILSRIQQGEAIAAEQLLPLVYEDLRRLAAHKLAHEKPGQTLQATALVHEAYLRLVKPEVDDGPTDSAADSPRSTPISWDSRGHFFAAAAEAMRRILIEQARRKRSLKAGGGIHREELFDIAAEATSDPLDVLALDEALAKLDRQNPRKAQLVKLRYFAGLTIEQAAEVMGVAVSTASADWDYAKSWLRLEMQPAD